MFDREQEEILQFAITDLEFCEELSQTEINLLAGGLKPPTNIHPGMSARVALTAFKGLSYVAASFTAGYAVGEWLNKNTPVQKWISKLYE